MSLQVYDAISYLKSLYGVVVTSSFFYSLFYKIKIIKPKTTKV